MSLIQDKIKELEEKAKSYQDCSNFISYQWIQKDDYGSDLKVYESEPKREYRGKLKE